MKDNWWNHNTDKVLLFVLVLIMCYMVMHIIHHDNSGPALEWAENSFSTVLGALILILTGRVQRADGQTANGAPPTTPSVMITPEPPKPAGSITVK